MWGSVLAAFGIGALAGGIAAIRAKPHRPMVAATLAASVFAVPLALLAAHAPVPLIAVGALLAGVGMMFGNAVWESTLQRHIPVEALSRVSAYDWFGSLAFQPIGLAIWGPISALLGIEGSLWLASTLLATTTLALLAVPDIRRVRASPGADADSGVLSASSAGS